MHWNFFLDGRALYLQWKRQPSEMYLILGLERVHCLGLPAKGRVLGKMRSLHPESDGFTGETKTWLHEDHSFWELKPGATGQTSSRAWPTTTDITNGNGGNCGQFFPDWLYVVSNPANQGTAGPHYLWPSSTFHTFSLPPRWRKTRI